MNSQLFSSSLYLSLVCFLLVILLKIQSSSTNPDLCRHPFKCGTVKAGYPFWGESYRPDPSCGHPKLKLDCDYEHETTTIRINEVIYHVLEINESTHTLKIAREDYKEGICPAQWKNGLFGVHNTTIDSQLFDFSPADEYENVTLLYGCPPPLSPNIPEHFTCQINGFPYNTGSIKGGANGPGACMASVFVPVPKKLYEATIGNWSALEETLPRGFELNWMVKGMPCEDCTNSMGSCGEHAQEFQWCTWTEKEDSITAAVVGILIILSIFLISPSGRSYTLDKVMVFLKKKTEDDRNIEAFVKNFGSLALRKYNYSDVKRMTKSFSDKLGQGGYGDVYRGKLPDGRLVAVKFLKQSKGNGEEFINEVASISRTSHINIVALLGFCYERKKKALIYEFMPNGSLDNFIYNKESSSTNRNLEWKTMYQIVVGIAKGLEYLHRGCNTRIVHFDIKPHNILLDEDFCPKIADFGLAKLCKKKESMISMLGARGTIGYIAPEVFCRTFGEVSHKSDVYSYGMMILEMVGGRKNIDVRVSHTSEIYFPNWIYKQLELGKDFEFHGVVTEEEKELAKKMVLVSLWCIQTIPSDRPSITRVVEMLEGGLESLQVPPKPSLTSQTRSPQHISQITSSSTTT
ncbi:hypothetical protein ACOSQ2_026470 [Xanthoceras sorbifolium]